jgi:hypothetical protein
MAIEVLTYAMPDACDVYGTAYLDLKSFPTT